MLKRKRIKFSTKNDIFYNKTIRYSIKNKIYTAFFLNYFIFSLIKIIKF